MNLETCVPKLYKLFNNHKLNQVTSTLICSLNFLLKILHLTSDIRFEFISIFNQTDLHFLILLTNHYY